MCIPPREHMTTRGNNPITSRVRGESSIITGTRTAIKMSTLVIIVNAAKMSMIKEYETFDRKSTFFLKKL